MREPTKEQFLKDVANHEMNVLLDQGIYRHLVFSQPQHRFHHQFELITTPGTLTITGDMGTWTFSRVRDMFAFFRSDQGDINPYYWSEKLQNGAGGGRNEAKVYDGDHYKANILDGLNNYDLTDEQKELVIDALELIDFYDEFYVYEQLRNFEVDLDDPEPYVPFLELVKQPIADRKREKFTFSELWEIDSKTYCYHFIWCCYAIVWGIQQYDKHKEEETCQNADATTVDSEDARIAGIQNQ